VAEKFFRLISPPEATFYTWKVARSACGLPCEPVGRYMGHKLPSLHQRLPEVVHNEMVPKIYLRYHGKKDRYPRTDLVRQEKTENRVVREKFRR
jgi:hypothetical protein